MYFYSASSGGFYLLEVHGDSIPSDAVLVGIQEYEVLINGQTQGKLIQPNKKGHPVLIDRPAESLVPSSVTMRQARLVLLKHGLLEKIEKAIDSLSEPQKTEAKIEWIYSNTVLRNQPLTVLLSSATGITEKQMDELFIEAETL